MLFFKHGVSDTAPASLRLKAFINYFEKKGYDSYFVYESDNILKKIIMAFKCKEDGIFISMPAFRNFWVFLIPNSTIILDIRDGWSIAQDSGYGHTTKSKPFKARLTRVVERFAIKRSFVTITCTPGLKTYLSNLSEKDVILIPNGINEVDLDYISSIKSISYKKIDRKLVFCCAGQFSEYGVEKVKKLLSTIASRYQNHQILIKLIGSNPELNSWTIDFFRQLTQHRGNIEILPKMDRKKLMSEMLKADYGLTIVRDPDYEFGTKVYDYIALGLPIVNYFDKPNNFTDYFDPHMDIPFKGNTPEPEIRRNILIDSKLSQFFRD